MNNSWSKNRLDTDGKLKILIQVNTSREENKNGIEPGKLPELFEFINEKCDALKCEGELEKINKNLLVLIFLCSISEN